MIDTIILRLHNLDKYETLIRRLDLLDQTGCTSETAQVDPDEVKRLRGMGFRKPKEIIDILKINRTGEFLVKTKVSKHMNASNHYAFTYFVNWTKNYVEFNFSVPKYTYGSNVLMYIEHMRDRDFRFFDNSTFQHNLNKVPGMTIGFIKHFLKKEFILDEVDLRDVEVHRIDVCFNQVFRSKDDALRYLEYQKRLKKKYAREEEGVMREYATSLMYVTKRYSAKIYHKGSEYEKNDLKEHLKINKEKGQDYFKTKKFQAFADRMLRYELTIRNGFLNYLFKHNLFRVSCGIFKQDYKCYMRVSNSIQKNDRIAEKVGKLPQDEKEKYLREHPYDKISKDDRRTYKEIQKIFDSRTFYMMAVSESVQQYNEKTTSLKTNKARFSSRLIKLCLEKLLSFINEFQIKELPDLERIELAIDLKNQWGRNQLPKADMLWFYKELMKHGSFKETAKYTGISRATMYRYKQRFKQIGISDKTIKPVDGYNIPEAKVDFDQYHSYLWLENDLLRGIKIC